MSDALIRITGLAKLMVDAKTNVDALTEQLSTAKEGYRRLEQEDLPELMREVELTEIKLADGSAVQLVDEIDCGITEERRPAAHEWLEENGFGGLIKTALSIEYGREEREAAKDDAAQITDVIERPVSVGEAVHPQTLKAFLKEQLAAGRAVPFELFGIRPYAKAKLTAAKKAPAPKAKRSPQPQPQPNPQEN